MNTKWFVVSATAVRFPDRAERAILGVILSIDLPIQAVFVVGEQLCDAGFPS